MIHSNSTGGTSRRSGTSPVFSFSDFERFLACYNVFIDDSESVRALLWSYGHLHLLPYLRFRRRSKLHGGLSATELKHLANLNGCLIQTILGAIGIIETQAKTTYAQALMHTYGIAALNDTSLFKCQKSYKKTLRAIGFEARRHSTSAFRISSNEEALSWLGLEHASFGTISQLIGNTRDKNVVSCVSESFGANNRCLLNWIHCLAIVRNYCAHFRPYIVLPQIPLVPKAVYGFEGEDSTSPLYALIVIERLLAGRVKAGIADAEEDLYNFTFEATLLLSDYASQFPNIARALRIPRNYCCQTISLPKVRIAPARIRPAAEYRFLALAT